MALEIERKFLVKDDAWKSKVSANAYCVQGYVETRPGCTVRVRILGNQGYLTVKGQRSGITRLEYEYPIPLEHAESMLNFLTGCQVSKTRHYVEHAGHMWEVDVFHGDNEGLVLAEIELSHEAEAFVKPAWVGEEVSMSGRYSNKSLAAKPYTQWQQEALCDGLTF